MIYLLKTSVFTHPSHVRSTRMVFSWDLGYDIWCVKYCHRAAQWWKLHYPTVISFDTIPACDRRTDRRT